MGDPDKPANKPKTPLLLSDSKPTPAVPVESPISSLPNGASIIPTVPTPSQKWNRRWRHLLDLVSSFNPFIDAARKHAIYLEEGKKGGGMRLAWYRFFFFLILSAIIGFICGWSVKEYLDRPTDNPRERIIRWQPPKLSTNANTVEIYFGGSMDRNGNIQGQPIILDVKQIEASNSVAIPVGSFGNTYKAINAHIFNNQFFLDLDIPTNLKPIQIRDGNITALPNGWDWNYNSNEFEIVDEQTQSIFAETYIKNNIVWVQGAVQYGGIILIAANYTTQPIPHGRFNPADIGLLTDFKYPSTNNLGIKNPQ